MFLLTTCRLLMFNRSPHSAGPSHLYDLSGVLGGDPFRAFAWNGSPPNIHIGSREGLGRVLVLGALFTPLSFCHTSLVIMTFLEKSVCGNYGKHYLYF